MSPATERIVLRALEEALALAVVNLVEVVNADTSDEGIERFEKGLAKAVNLHEQLRAQLEPACTATASPGC